MIDNKTQRLSLPLPNVDNYLEDDVVRLSEALEILDAKVATVGDDGKIPMSQIPAVALTETFPVNSEAAMLALNAQPGDVAIRNDLSKSFILMAAPATMLGNWKEVVNDALVQLSSTDRPGTDLISAKGGSTLTSYLNRAFLFIDDLPGVDKTGATDCSAAINAALVAMNGSGARLLGNGSSTYLIENTISFNGLSNITLDFNEAIVKDNVQGFIPTSGGRANHTFVIYNASKIHLTGLRYQQVSTRANGALAGKPNTCMIWVGGQYLGGAMTRDIKVTNIKNIENNACDDGFFLCGMGELDNILVEDIYLKGGNWNWGVNFEYGLQPEDTNVNPTMTNGRHPYNITVRKMRGENLISCDGFLRVGGAYNVKFEQCTGYNVTNFLHIFSGDRGVTRFGQNIHCSQLKAKHDPNVITWADNMIWIIVTDHDGSTGEALPTWTDRDHQITIENSEFWNNGALSGSCLRYVSNAGKCSLKNVTLRNGFYLVWAQPVGRATVNPRYSLTVEECVLKNGFQFIRGIDAQGMLFKHNTLKNRQAGSTSEAQVPAIVLSGDCSGTIFDGNLLTGHNGITATNWVNNQSDGVDFSNNTIDAVSVSTEVIVTTKYMTGENNKTNGILVSNAATSYRVIGEGPYPKVLDAAQTSVEFEKGAFWNSQVASTGTINRIIGGTVGKEVEFRGTVSTSSVTFAHADATVTDSTQRLLLKAGANQTVTGNTWSKRFKKMTNGWWEM